MKFLSHVLVLVLVICFAVGGFSCSAVQDIQKAFTNLTRCQFKLTNVDNFILAGIPLAGKNSINMLDGAKLVAAFAENSFPASFTLNVAARNPNDGTGGTPKASATLTSLAWTLVVDNTVTVNGNIGSSIVIPGTGQETVIPLPISLDLAQFFKDKGYEHIINLALALGGSNSSPSRITLRAKPTLQTDLGPISYPGEISIIDKEFRAQ
jgi:hypothetical protein